MAKESSPVDIRLNQTEIRLATARTWKNRIDALIKKMRKVYPPYSEAQFCRDHGFDAGFFNRLKNIKVVPTQRTVDSIEKALRKEGF